MYVYIHLSYNENEMIDDVSTDRISYHVKRQFILYCDGYTHAHTQGF